MTFRTALSGLNAAQSDLNVTANNIANSSTTGFKRSRAEFAELFAVSPQGVATLATGNGVRVSDVSQQFAQGSIDFTDSNLDLALSGPGFFTVSDGGALAYTRAGAFKTDAAGYVVNAQGQRLQVYPPIDGGGFNTGSLTDLRMVASESAPNAASMVESRAPRRRGVPRQIHQHFNHGRGLRSALRGDHAQIRQRAGIESA